LGPDAPLRPVHRRQPTRTNRGFPQYFAEKLAAHRLIVQFFADAWHFVITLFIRVITNVAFGWIILCDCEMLFRKN
jgi:hypothetical protein